MDERQTRLVAICGVLAGILVLNLIWNSMGPPDMAAILSDVEVSDELRDHVQEFAEPHVVKVTDGVHVAIGYALANSIMLEAPDGLIIVDVTESYESAKEIFQAFREISPKPVKAIIYTHNHADHIYGGKAFVEDTDDPVEIWSHHTFLDQLRRDMSTIQLTLFKRAMRQFGVLLPEVIHAGIGRRLRFDLQATMDVLYPNQFLYEKELNTTIAGMNLRLIHIPGETTDQIGVWIEDKKMFLCADDVYKAFPNLYAIRGTHTRDVLDWVNSIDIMRSLKPEFLVPSHTLPIESAEEISTLLTEYRDAIQFIHDQTVRWMNKGLFPDEIVQKVKLPAKLKENPHLKELYGTTQWSVKGVFNSYMGWFGGHPADLNPMNPEEKASKMALLAGGVKKLQTAASDALETDDPQWCLELTSHILRLQPNNYEVKKLQALSLKKLAITQTSANGRNYYLTYAFEQHKLVENKPPEKNRQKIIMTIPLIQLFNAMSRRLKAEAAEDVNTLVTFHFTDTSESVSVHVRNGIAEVTHEGKENSDIEVTTTTQIWRELAAKTRSALGAYTTGSLEIKGGVTEFKSFMELFDTDE